ncbi:hypothetical protein CVT25_009587 [Psilocybe cyanescens]|uniref:Uncharacterized protein n=1 Tax=Psilocybe cyanescens TaxID=93625 RepID=A0A409XDQ6_PSICY|nr:hypothetical protein CVT25_009587 [Psilocybe cyanescens]
MATLQNKKIVIVGGSAGIGFAVALAALQCQANRAIDRLKAHKLPGKIQGHVLDAKDLAAVQIFSGKFGTVDHIVWTSGDVPSAPGSGLPYSNIQTVEEGQAGFLVRFWGPFVLAKHAEFEPGGSLTLTSAPIRVNVISPGACNHQAFDKPFGGQKENMLEMFQERTLLKRTGDPRERFRYEEIQ